jgi:hypothetical protein
MDDTLLIMTEFLQMKLLSAKARHLQLHSMTGKTIQESITKTDISGEAITITKKIKKRTMRRVITTMEETKANITRKIYITTFRNWSTVPASLIYACGVWSLPLHSWESSLLGRKPVRMANGTPEELGFAYTSPSLSASEEWYAALSL